MASPIAALRATILAVRRKVRLRRYLSMQIHDVATPVGLAFKLICYSIRCQRAFCYT
jgi:hypothetical protein